MVWKPHVTVAAVIEQDQRFLVVEEHTPNGLAFNQPAGHLENNESLIDAVKREVLEETDLDATQYKLEDWQFAQTYEIYEHWRYRYAPGVTENVEHVFGLELPAAVDVKLAPREHVAFEWVDWRDAAKRVFSWTNVEALRLLGQRHNLTL